MWNNQLIDNKTSKRGKTMTILVHFSFKNFRNLIESDTSFLSLLSPTTIILVHHHVWMMMEFNPSDVCLFAEEEECHHCNDKLFWCHY
jgi:hypothetical protein